MTVLAGIAAAIESGATIIPGTHIMFRREPGMEKGITEIYSVNASVVVQVSEPIGFVKWFGRWRKYCFFPNTNTVYEETCLREISEFCQQLTKAHREKKKAISNP